LSLAFKILFMVNKRFDLNYFSYLFDDEGDKANNYWTIVFNPVEEKFIRVNPVGYKILKTIEENPSIDFLNLISRLKIKESSLTSFLKEMEKENVLFIS